MLVSTMDNGKTRYSVFLLSMFLQTGSKVPSRLKIIETELNRSVQIHR